MVVTGDDSQKDLPAGTRSGLDIACRVLKNVEGIAFCKLTSRDVVRHPLVQKIVQAYEVYEAKEQNRENKDNSRRRENVKNKGRK